MDALLTLRNSREEIKICNDTKIQYIKVNEKVYKVTGINWQHLTLEAEEAGRLRVVDVPESELWDISELEEFNIRLVNNDSRAGVIDMAEWKKGHGIGSEFWR